MYGIMEAKISWRKKWKTWGETGRIVVGSLAYLYLTDQTAANK